MVKQAYADLFEIHGDDAWTLPKDKLLTFFRKADKTSEVIGQRQVGVFTTFASLAGRERAGDAVKKPSDKGAKKVAKASSAPTPKRTKEDPKRKVEPGKVEDDEGPLRRDMAMTVRIEINLPSDGSRETYDNIFKSIRANLIDE